MKLQRALILTALLGLPVAVLAQPPAPPPDAPSHGKHFPPSPERMTEHMSQSLGLDAQQATKLRALNQKHAADMKRLRDDHEKGLRQILTPEQWTKFEAMRTQRHERFREHRKDPAAPAS